MARSTRERASGEFQVCAGAATGTAAILVAATFSASAPTVTFFYGRYGDFSASRAGTRYASSAEFAQALGLWREELLDRFAPVLGSGSAGTDAVGGPITATGNLLAAAPR